MAIIFWGVAVAGGAIVGAAAADDYSDYSNYSDYSDYSNYSDHAEREAQRQAQRKREIAFAKEELKEYAEDNLLPFLKENDIFVDYDQVEHELEKKKANEINVKNFKLKKEIEYIDNIIDKLDKFT